MVVSTHRVTRYVDVVAVRDKRPSWPLRKGPPPTTHELHSSVYPPAVFLTSFLLFYCSKIFLFLFFTSFIILSPLVRVFTLPSMDVLEGQVFTYHIFLEINSFVSCFPSCYVDLVLLRLCLFHLHKLYSLEFLSSVTQGPLDPT